MKRKVLFLFLSITLLLTMTSCNNQKSKELKETQSNNTSEQNKETEIQPPKMTLIGHASVKLVTKKGTVIYIDPFYEGDYSEPADIILVTHGHSDHNNIDLVTQKDSTQIITYKDALKDGTYESFEVGDVKIKAVPAYNANHDKRNCVGYILNFDNISLYHAGDTSKIPEMSDLTALKLTYALLPIDGIYNMGYKEATEVANIIGAKYNIPIHTSTDQKPYDADKAAKFTPKGQLLVKYGDTIHLDD